jgi:hypothetical protein
MKALFLSLLSILFIANCQAQIDTNLSVVSAVKMNVIYRGLPNPIAVAVPGYQEKDIIVTTSQGTLTKSDVPNTYYIKVPYGNQSKDLLITICIRVSNSEAKKVGVHKYVIKNLPEPTIMLGSINESGKYSSLQIQAASFIYTYLDGFVYEGLSFRPENYTIIYKPLNEKEKIFNGSGPVLSDEIKEMFNNIKSGDKIVVQDVNASGINGKIYVHQHLFIEVKD